VIQPDKMSNISTSLITKFQVFDFATLFANQYESIAPPGKFEISGETYNQFKTFLKENNFEYHSESEEMLEELIKKAKEEKYYELASAEFAEIESNLEPKLEKDLEVFSDEIKNLLENEIVSRYYFQKGAIRASIGEDKVIERAVEELSHPAAYNEYFKPGTVISSE